jgi:glycosyltransferase involved in cell wall biosynthesis
VFVGRLDVHRKGLDVLVRGVSEAPGWHLALVGPRFRDVGRLERMIADLRLSDRVHLVGERHGRGLRESVRAADLFVLMSRWEGLPMVLLEALALGRPAVVSGAVEGSVPVAGAGAGWVAGDEDLGNGVAGDHTDGTGRARRARPRGPALVPSLRLGLGRRELRGGVRARG